MVAIQFRYFHLASQRIFADFSFLRSLGQKMRTFDVDVEKEKEKKDKLKIRVSPHKCCASHRIKYQIDVRAKKRHRILCMNDH